MRQYHVASPASPTRAMRWIPPADTVTQIMEERTVVVCSSCGELWALGEQSRCDDESHAHDRFDVHIHRDTVGFPDGTEVVAVSFDADAPYSRDQPPDYGLYLDERWRPPWTHEHLAWPDFGVPADSASLTTALAGLLERARAGERVEIGCLGGHGRTGTALGCLATMAGVPADEAVGWVRATYCSHAIETPEQEALVAGFDV